MGINNKTLIILAFLVVSLFTISFISAASDSTKDCKSYCEQEKHTCIKESKTTFKACNSTKGCMKSYSLDIKNCNNNYSPCVNNCNNNKCAQDEYFVKNKCSKVCVFDKDCGPNRKCINNNLCLTPKYCSIVMCPSACYGYCTR